MSYACIISRNKLEWGNIHFNRLFHFSTTWKCKKTFGFLMFSGGMEIEHWVKWVKCSNRFWKIDSAFDLFQTNQVGLYGWKTCREWLNPFIHYFKKWSNMLLKSCSLNTARFLKYVWPFFNIMNERINLVRWYGWKTKITYCYRFFCFQINCK